MIHDSAHQEDKRKTVRRELCFYLLVRDAATGEEYGRVIDIHESGILLMSETALPNGSVRDVTMDVPKSLAEMGLKEIRLTIEIMWSRPYNAEIVQTGARFINPDAAAVSAVKQLIGLYEIPLQHQSDSGDDDD